MIGLLKRKKEIKMKALLLTSSTDGQTEKIMRVIAAEMLINDYEMMNIHEDIMQKGQKIDWKAYDKIVIGASIRYGHYHKNLYQFIEKYAHELNQKTAYFFGVNLVARKIGKNTPQSNSYTKKFLKKIKWKPTKSAVFAGACRWSMYNFWQTKIIQFIMIITKGPTDTTKDVEFTDWNNVCSFAKSL